jgi:hypothetical protein
MYLHSSQHALNIASFVDCLVADAFVCLSAVCCAACLQRVLSALQMEQSLQQ